MLRRVLKRKEQDRALWVTLFVLTVVGVAVAVKLTHNAEKKRAGWVGGAPPVSEFEQNPLVPHSPDSSPTPVMQAVASNSTPPVSAPAGPAVKVVELLTTPVNVTAAAMTPACRAALRTRGPWLDARAGRPWPECVDPAGNAMVVQFCTYARLATGEWVPSENTRTAPRCQAELPLVRQGKLRGVASR